MLCTKLWETINQAIVAYDHVLSRLRDDVIDACGHFAATVDDEAVSNDSLSLAEKIGHGVSVADLTENELRVLVFVLHELHVPSAEPAVEESIPPVITGEEIVEDVVVVH
jgi:hypothetical protein